MARSEGGCPRLRRTGHWQTPAAAPMLASLIDYMFHLRAGAPEPKGVVLVEGGNGDYYETGREYTMKFKLDLSRGAPFEKFPVNLLNSSCQFRYDQATWVQAIAAADAGGVNYSCIFKAPGLLA